MFHFSSKTSGKQKIKTCKISQRAIFLKQRGRNKEKFLYVE